MTLNYACIFGRVKLVLYDDRPESPTGGAVEEHFLGPDDHSLVVIPPGHLDRLQGDEPSRSPSSPTAARTRTTRAGRRGSTRSTTTIPVRLGRPAALTMDRRAEHDAARQRRSGPRSCTGSSPSSIRSAGASPATGCARPCAAIGELVPARTPRGADRDAGLRLDDPARVEHPRRLREGRAGPAGGRLPRRATSTSSATARRSTRGCRSRSFAQHLTTIPEHPDWIPYRTSYYQEDWGFCLSHNALLGTRGGRVRGLHRQHARGRAASPTASATSPGERGDEVLISTHVCHPSLANDNLSGIAVATFLAPDAGGAAAAALVPVPVRPRDDRRDRLAAREPGRTSRGSGTGSCSPASATPDTLTYKRSRRGDAEIDRAVAHVLAPLRRRPTSSLDFSPYGYDERQYCSPGFDLPVGCFMRTPHGRFPEYHTSADDLELVRPDAPGRLAAEGAGGTVRARGQRDLRQPQPRLRTAARPARAVPAPPAAGTTRASGELALLWVLNLSDSRHSLLDIAERSGLEFGGDQGGGRRAARARPAARRPT